MLRHSYKKFAALLLAGTTAFCSLTACGQKEVVLDSSAASPAPAAPAAPSYDVIETPAKKPASIFDDPEEDESDVLPIFKGRNIFSNNNNN